MKKQSTICIALLCFSASLCYAQKNLQLLSNLKFSGRSCAGVWHYVDTTGKEYAIVGTSTAISIVDISTPASPKVKFEVTVNQSIWQELRVWKKYVYCGTEGGGGITIVDLSKLPASIKQKVYTGDGAIAGKVDKSHTVQVFDGYLYINGSTAITNRGSTICSLADPWNPVYVGSYDAHYVHDCDVRNDTLYTSEIKDGQFVIVDIKSKTSPQILASQSTPFNYTHNTALSDNGKVIFTTDEKVNAPLAAYDISDLNNIKLLDKYLTIEIPAQEVHNVRVLNDFLVNACYGSQVTIVDAHKPDNLVEVANYTIGTGIGWDVDPYLPSGLLLATNGGNGLFVFRPTYKRACYLEGIVRDSMTNNPINTAKVELLTTKITDSSEIAGNYKTGYADAGTYNVRFSKAGYNTRTINGVKLVSGTITGLNVKLLKLGAGIGDIENENSILLYPNPVQDEFNVTIHGGEFTDLNFVMYDISGAEKIREKINAVHSKFSIQSLSAGIYLCRITDKNGAVLRAEKIVRVE